MDQLAGESGLADGEVMQQPSSMLEGRKRQRPDDDESKDGQLKEPRTAWRTIPQSDGAYDSPTSSGALCHDGECPGLRWLFASGVFACIEQDGEHCTQLCLLIVQVSAVQCCLMQLSSTMLPICHADPRAARCWRQTS